jgi:integrase
MLMQAPLPDKDDLAGQGIHPSYILHSSISFDEDRWDLNFRSTVARPCAGRISFAEFSSAVKNYVKEFIADGIFVAGLSNGWAVKVMTTLRKTFRVFEKRHNADISPLAWTRYDAIALEDYIREAGVTRPREELVIVARFAAFLRERHNGLPAEFHPNPLVVPRHKETRRTYSEGLEQVIPDEVSAAIMEAIGRYQLFLQEKSKTSSAKYLQSHQLYLSILVLLFFSGRRISEVLLLRRECLREPSVDELTQTGEGVWLQYDNTEVGLGLVEIFITEPGADLVRKMVEHVQVLTDSLAVWSEKDNLFLTDSPLAGIRSITANSFNSWLNGYLTEDNQVVRPGFIHRYNIKFMGEYYYINPHQMRHTLAYKAYMGGASYVDVGDHLHHKRTIDGLSPMTGVYIHGQEKDVQLIREMHAKRKVLGRAVPLIDNRLVVLNDLSSTDVAIWREQGMILHPTHYGH